MSFDKSKDGAEEPAVASLPVIEGRGLGKCFRMYEKPIHRLLHRFGKHKASNEFWALKDIGFEIGRGETLGVIGRNGSGKSTLLQIIAGTLAPTEGEIQVRGRVAALLELGSGFNPDFSGRENVLMNAAILGLSRAEIDRRFDSIIAFADIGDFIDQPVRSYSSGMVVRLAFAVIAHVDADILIIDEALSVGDTFFSQKCMRFLRDFQSRGTLLFVSHDAAAVVNLCRRAIWLENGRIKMAGPAQEVVENYMAQQHAAERSSVDGSEVKVVRKDAAQRPRATENDFRAGTFDLTGQGNPIRVYEFNPDDTGVEFGAKQATIVTVGILDAHAAPVDLIAGGEIVVLRISVQVHAPLENLIVGFYVKDRLGQRLFGDNTYLVYQENGLQGAAGERIHADFRFRMPILPRAAYTVDAAVASGTQQEHTQQHWIHDAIEFRALDSTMRFGLIGIPMLDIQVVRGQVA
ncbi:MAG: ABC transporter ATP-binding protein [Lysobacter sp.]|nr:ABC transporter ATP-binding protein [Lysobacter sp.]